VTFEQYLESLGVRVSNVKRLILQLLWDSSEAFPKGWVSSSQLLEATQQKYFDRRIRELRDEVGCAIETGNTADGAAYRLVSSTVQPANPRGYLTQTQKRALFQRDGYCCQICGKTVDPGARGLQADHRVPLIRGCTHEMDNWQSLCNECNVAKRRACERCTDDCGSCSWAFPGETGQLILVRLPLAMSQALKRLGITTPRDIELRLLQSLEDDLGKNH